MNKTKLFLSATTLSLCVVPLTMISCSNSDAQYTKFENTIRFKDKNYTRSVSAADFLNDSSGIDYYSELFTYTLLRKPEIYQKFFIAPGDTPKESSAKLKALNEKIATIIKDNKIIQKMLKIYFAQSLYYLYHDLWDKDINDDFFKIEDDKNISDNYSIYSDLIAPDDKDVKSDKYKFTKLDKIVESIGTIKIELVDNPELAGDNLAYFWKYSFKINKDSQLIKLFQKDNGETKKGAIYKSELSLSPIEEAFIASKDKDKQDEIRKFLEYRASGIYWDNATTTLNSIYMQSRISVKNTQQTPFNRYLAEANENGAKQIFSVNSLISLDFIQESARYFKPVIRFNSAQLFSKSTLSYWNNYMDWIQKQTDMKIYREKNIYFDVGFESFKYERFKNN